MLWTEQHIETLKRLWEEGLSGAQIAAQMGTTRNAIIGKAHRLNMKRERKKISTPRGAISARARRSRAQPPRPKPSPPVPLRVPQPQPVVTSRPMALLDLTMFSCRFPLWEHQRPGDPLPETPLYCGAPVMLGAYCKHHAQKCYLRA